MTASALVIALDGVCIACVDLRGLDLFRLELSCHRSDAPKPWIRASGQTTKRQQDVPAQTRVWIDFQQLALGARLTAQLLPHADHATTGVLLEIEDADASMEIPWDEVKNPAAWQALREPEMTTPRVWEHMQWQWALGDEAPTAWQSTDDTYRVQCDITWLAPRPDRMRVALQTSTYAQWLVAESTSLCDARLPVGHSVALMVTQP